MVKRAQPTVQGLGVHTSQSRTRQGLPHTHTHCVGENMKEGLTRVECLDTTWPARVHLSPKGASTERIRSEDLSLDPSFPLSSLPNTGAGKIEPHIPQSLFAPSGQRLSIFRLLPPTRLNSFFTRYCCLNTVARTSLFLSLQETGLPLSRVTRPTCSEKDTPIPLHSYHSLQGGFNTI